MEETGMTADLQRLEELYGKATPGEWLVDRRTVYALNSRENNRFYAGVSLGLDDNNKPVPQAELLSNAELIAALHNAFPSLLARIRELEADVAKVIRQRDLWDATCQSLKSELAAAEARAAAMQAERDGAAPPSPDQRPERRVAQRRVDKPSLNYKYRADGSRIERVADRRKPTERSASAPQGQPGKVWINPLDLERLEQGQLTSAPVYGSAPPGVSMPLYASPAGQWVSVPTREQELRLAWESGIEAARHYISGSTFGAREEPTVNGILGLLATLKENELWGPPKPADWPIRPASPEPRKP